MTRWKVHQVPAWMIRSLTRPTTSRTWEEREERLLTDNVDLRRVEELTAEIARKGFERPVLIEWDRWWDPRPIITDGEHRCLVALNLDIPVPVRFRRSPFDDAYDHSDVYLVTSTTADVDHLVDMVMSGASFRCTAGPWIQTDTVSGGPDGVEVYLPRYEELRVTIQQELAGRLGELGVDATVRFLENRPVEAAT